MTQTSAQDNLKRLGIVLPNPVSPAAAYVMSVQTGNLVFLSGHTAKQNGKPWVGKLGASMTTASSDSSRNSCVAVPCAIRCHLPRA